MDKEKLGSHSSSELQAQPETKVPDKLPIDMDRLRPRGMERSMKRSSPESDSNDRKKLKEGQEEMEKLKTLVPTLRERDGRVSQVDIIEETISYIDQLHRRIAERLVSSTTVEEISEPGTSLSRDDEVASVSQKKPIVLTLEQLQTAERMSQEIECSGGGGFAARLAELSKAAKYNSEMSNEVEDGEDDSSDEDEVVNDQNEKHDEPNIFNHAINGEHQIIKENMDKSDNEVNESTAFNDVKPTDDKKRAIEAVKASFVALLSSQSPDD